LVLSLPGKARVPVWSVACYHAGLKIPQLPVAASGFFGIFLSLSIIILCIPDFATCFLPGLPLQPSSSLEFRLQECSRQLDLE